MEKLCKNWRKYRKKYFKVPDPEVIPAYLYKRHPDYIPVYNEEFRRLVPRPIDTRFWERYNEEDDYGKMIYLDAFTDDLKKGYYTPGVMSSPDWHENMVWEESTKHLRNDHPPVPTPTMGDVVDRLIENMVFKEEDKEMIEQVRRGGWIKVGYWPEDEK